jgi:hypothetical protein
MNNIENPFDLLLGTWQGDKGLDIAPEPDGTETNPYYETITFSKTSDVENAESEYLFVVQYQQVVRRKSTGKIFHDQSGYWMWNAKENMLMHSFSIPRGVCVLAKGEMEKDQNNLVLEVSATAGDDNFGIIQSQFMQENAKTSSFKQKLVLKDGVLTYSQTTILEIYGKIFEHTDDNILKLR